jgi:hypothetical protein
MESAQKECFMFKENCCVNLLILLLIAPIICAQDCYFQQFLINTHIDKDQYYPAVAALKNGGFIVCWDRDAYYHDAVSFQLFDGCARKVGSEFLLSDTLNPNYFNDMDVLSDGAIVVCWNSYLQDDGAHTFGQVLAENGEKKDDKFEITKTTLMDGSYYPPLVKVAALKDGHIAVCWTYQTVDHEHQAYLVCQIFDKDGNRIGIQTTVNTDGLQWFSCVDFDIIPAGQEKFIIVWRDCDIDSSPPFFYTQFFNCDGNRIGSNIKIDLQTDRGDLSFYPTAAGGFAVCWPFNGSVYIQFFDEACSKIGAEIFLRDGASEYVVVPMEDEGFAVSWIGQGLQKDGNRDVFCRLITRNGQSCGNGFRVNSFSPYNQDYPALAQLTNGGFVVCWQGWSEQSQSWDIYGKVFPPPVENVTLHNFSLLYPSHDQTISTKSPTFMWESATDDSSFYPWELTYEIFVSRDLNFENPVLSAETIDTTFTVDPLIDEETYFWKVAARNLAGEIVESSSVNGFYVPLNAQVKNTDNREALANFVLFQNHPNPFNNETSVQYQLSETAAVNLKIYDISGKIVKQFIQGEQSIGLHQIEWDGTDQNRFPVASGIYYCSLEIKDTNEQKYQNVKKMCLLK